MLRLAALLIFGQPALSTSRHAQLAGHAYTWHPLSAPKTMSRMPAQEISDTIALRKRIQDCFELAALPGTPEADIRKALHFIVVGGGPTVRPPSHCDQVSRIGVWTSLMSHEVSRRF